MPAAPPAPAWGDPGGNDTIGGAFEERPGGFLLQLGDGTVDRRLGETHALCGKGEVLCLANGDQRFELG